MDLSDFNLVRLTPEHIIKPFDCGDTDLNDFLFQDSKTYFQNLFAVTYIIESEKETIAFFSLLNDKISFKEVNSNTSWESFCDLISNGNNIKSFPAVKIGRLGVTKDYSNKGIGSNILDYLKFKFISNNRTGCRCLTVDAYTDSLEFYIKNDFDYLTKKDANRDTRLMYYDLNLLQ